MSTNGIQVTGEAARRTTIGEVAARAGVSIATVSRVVNGRYGVSTKTADHVRGVIEELGYESSLVARSLRSDRNNIIGVLVSGIEPFSTELLKGIGAELQDSGYALIVYSGGTSGERGWERRYLSRLSADLTDGTILVTPGVVDVVSPRPVVAVDPHVGGSHVSTVAAQNYEGARTAVEHLVGLGHRRIAFLAGRPDLESGRLREAGYRAALDDAGIAYDPELVQIGGFTTERAMAPARALLSLGDPPTAIFAANDLSALAVFEAAADMGIAVPADLSVVGFDNIPESALTEPPLTTVDQSIQALGREAVRLLLVHIDAVTDGAPHAPEHILLPTELVIRKSCAPPRR